MISMAKIVFAAGTSHTPMLLAADEILSRFAETDQKMKHRDKEGRPVTYGDLLERADPKLAQLVAPENLVARQNVARAAAGRLREAVRAAALDTLIVFGDDQNESYLEDCRPTFAIYYGDTIRNGSTQHSTYADLPDWYIRNRAGFFTSAMDVELQERLRLERCVREALRDDGFKLHFQPLVDMPAANVTGFEALLRLTDADGRPIPPMTFIPIAEETGLITQMGDWVLRAACAEAARWPSDVRIAVNLSVMQFKKPNLADAVLLALAEAGLPPERLELEITETALIESAAECLPALRQFKKLGITIVLDDFGTGYSSLSQ